MFFAFLNNTLSTKAFFIWYLFYLMTDYIFRLHVCFHSKALFDFVLLYAIPAFITIAFLTVLAFSSTGKKTSKTKISS